MKNIILRSCSLAGISLATAFMAVTQAFATMVTVTVRDSFGNPIPGVLVHYTQNNFNNYSSAYTDANGVITRDLTGTWQFRANYNYTSAIQAQNVGADPDRTFYTSECQAQVNKHDGTAFAGVLVHFSPNNFNNYLSIYADPNGLAKAQIFPATIYLRANVNYTAAIQTVQLAGDGKTAGQNSLGTFYTSESVAKVQGCDGLAFAGVLVHFSPNNYNNYLSIYTDVNGLAPVEVFPSATWVIRAWQYNTVQVQSQLVAGNGMTVNQSTTTTFKPTKIQFVSGVPISYWNGQYWNSFPSPGYMFPATVKFRLSGAANMEVTLAISGCEMVGAMLQLKDASGNGVAGGQATPATGGAWNATVPGATDANGRLFALLPTGFTKIRMAVNQSSQEKSKAQLQTDRYTWQTSTATINVKNAAGGGISGVVIDQAGGIWVSRIATTDASGVAKIPVFAGGTKFRANYNKTAQEISQAVPSTFVFQTGAVHSDSGTCTTWATSSWNVFTQDMEVLPGAYRFGPPIDWHTITAGIVNHID